MDTEEKLNRESGNPYAISTDNFKIFLFCIIIEWMDWTGLARRSRQGLYSKIMEKIIECQLAIISKNFKTWEI